jgi:hypothetical protein
LKRRIKTLCGSCSFFKPHKTAFPGAGINSMCLRNPGYVWYETSEACRFFKEKKVTKKKKEKLLGECKAMKPRCSSCAHFKPGMPAVYVGAGGNSECSRDPGYFRAGVSDSCEFYVKKGKRVTKPKTKEHPKTIYSPSVGEEKIKCVDCHKEKKKKDMRYLGTYGDKWLFRCLPCVHKRLEDKKLEGKLCGRCADTFLGQTYPVIGFHLPICGRCYAEMKQEGSLPVTVCTNCNGPIKGESRFRVGSKRPICQDCFEHLHIDYGDKKPAEVPKSSTCVNCGKRFKTTVFIKEGGEAVCFSCKKKEPPKPTCTVCGEIIKGGEYAYRDGTLCFACHKLRKDDIFKEGEVVTENPIHERFLVVEGRGAWPSTNVYTHDFSNCASALKFVDRYRPDTCKMFRVSSTAPITLEELSLGYDIKVVSTHEMKEPK